MTPPVAAWLLNKFNMMMRSSQGTAAHLSHGRVPARGEVVVEHGDDALERVPVGQQLVLHRHSRQCGEMWWCSSVVSSLDDG